MTLHIFNCSKHKLRTGLTADKTGANLPANACQGGSWIYWETIDMNLGEPPRIGTAPTNAILEAIAKDGYFINETTITFEEKIVK
ncbi:hypothetical protein ABID42_004236 [Arcicella rosea]|uniref:hypothetical protein n=1 Tax=Arcicella rosea TaxID=502909 RepID=UPI00345CC2EA